MKHIFIGDIHGQWEIVEEALSRDGVKVFVGDFVDSFTRTTEDMYKCYCLLMEYHHSHPDELVCLFGNHELSYYHYNMRCSGWRTDTHEMMQDIKGPLHELLRSHYWFDEDSDSAPTLVTHAGVSSTWLSQFDDDDMAWHELNQYSLDYAGPLFDIGRRRGGWAVCGGPFWCDYRDEFVHVPYINQIFGHTRGKGIRMFKHTNGDGTEGFNACIDCLEDGEPQFLEIEA